MSINLFALAWNISFPGKPAKKLVLLSLADSINAAHDYTWPSYETIAARCGISRRAVINAVNELEAEGIITREARYKSPGNRTSNAFRLNEDRMRQLIEKDLPRKSQNALPAGPGQWCSELNSPGVVNSIHQGSEHSSPGVVNTVHQGSEYSSLGVVNSVHQGSEHSSPKPEIEPEDRTGMEPIRDRGTSVTVRAPARPTVSSPSFQPIPEDVRKAKARRGESELEAVPDTLPVLSALHELTGYWPGEANAGAIAAVVGENPDRSTLARAVELWRASGHKVTNWLGICDWYIELSRDPDWTPQARFKVRPNGSVAPGLSLSPAEQAAERYVKAKRAILGENQ